MQRYETCTHPGCGLITLVMGTGTLVHVVAGGGGMSTKQSKRGGQHDAKLR